MRTKHPMFGKKHWVFLNTATKDLEFERAANLRDEIEKMKKLIK